MSWQIPKRNWKNKKDFFNHIDYNRITGNIDYIREMLELDSLFTPKSIDGYMRVSEYNAITHEINRLIETEGFNIEKLNIPDRNDHSTPWGATQLNMIENCLYEMYLTLRGDRVQIVDEHREYRLVSEDKNYNIYSD